jgi:hypothetical protein
MIARKAMRPRSLTAALLAGLLATVTVSTQAPGPRQLELSFDQEGHVTLIANNVTLREILAEWARRGGTRIVNLEKLAGGPIEYPIRFENAAEMDVMQALLRGVAGKAYVPRVLGTPGASRLEIVHLTPVSNASGALVAAPPATPNPNIPTRGAPEDEIPPVNRNPPAAGPPQQGQTQGYQQPGTQQWQQQQQPSLPQNYQQQSPLPGMPGSALPGSGLPGGSALPQIVPITPINSNQPATTTQPPATGRGAPPPPPNTGAGS